MRSIVERSPDAPIAALPASRFVATVRVVLEGEKRKRPPDQPVEDTHLRLLRLLDSQPGLSQRALASELGVSLGKTNYCLKALADKGWIKIRNFRNSANKLGYLYLLTPRGLERKASITVRFLREKRAEYETLKREIELLKHEVDDSRNSNHPR